MRTDLGDGAWLAGELRDLRSMIENFLRGGFLQNASVDATDTSGATMTLMGGADGSNAPGIQFDYGPNTLGLYQTSDGKLHVHLIAGASGVAFDANVPVTVAGSFTVTGTKSFAAEHPDVPGAWVVHAATESPVNGIEYWGTVTLDQTGSAAVVLPRYFEGLAKAENRAVFLTPQGAQFAVSASAIAGGAFTITGRPGGTVSWLVKAERRSTGTANIEFLDESLTAPGTAADAIPVDRPGQPMSGHRPDPAHWPTA